MTIQQAIVTPTWQAIFRTGNQPLVICLCPMEVPSHDALESKLLLRKFLLKQNILPYPTAHAKQFGSKTSMKLGIPSRQSPSIQSHESYSYTFHNALKAARGEEWIILV